MYGVLWCNLNLICIAMKHPGHRRHLKLLAFTGTFNIFFISNAISSQLNTVNCKLHCTRILQTEILNQNVQYFLSNDPQYRVLWNNLAFKSSLCFLPARFYNFGPLPCLLLTWGSDMSRSISGHNMNTSIGLHIRSTSGVSRDNRRIGQFLKNCEAHMQKLLCGNSTATGVLLFRPVKQGTKY
jgi:hypothetical protein